MEQGIHTDSALHYDSFAGRPQDDTRHANTRDVFPFNVTSGHCPAGKTEKVNCWPMPEVTNNEDMTRFLNVVGVSSQREIERIVREGKIEGSTLKLRMTLTAEGTPLNHVVEETIDLR
jgi:hypothetical protein